MYYVNLMKLSYY